MPFIVNFILISIVEIGYYTFAANFSLLLGMEAEYVIGNVCQCETCICNRPQIIRRATIEILVSLIVNSVLIFILQQWN